MFKSFLILLLKSYSIPLVSRFSPFLTSIFFFLLSLFILIFLVSYFPLLVVDLASSSEEVPDYIYHSIGDNSDSPLSGDPNVDPVSVETRPTLPSSLDDFIKNPVLDDE